MNDEHATNGTDMVPVDRIQPRTRLTKIDEWDDGLRSIRTSIDTATDVGRTSYLACLTGSDYEARDCVGRELIVTGWLLHIVDRIDDATGETSDGLRLVLVCSDGTTVSTASGSLIDNWGHVVRMFGMEQPFPALAIAIKATASRRNQGRYLQLASVRRATKTTGEKPKGK